MFPTRSRGSLLRQVLPCRLLFTQDGSPLRPHRGLIQRLLVGRANVFPTSIGGVPFRSRLPTCRASAPESARSAVDHLKPVRGTGICRWLFGPALGSPKTCQIRTQSNCVAVATEFGVPEPQGLGGSRAASTLSAFQRVKLPDEWVTPAVRRRDVGHSHPGRPESAKQCP